MTSLKDLIEAKAKEAWNSLRIPCGVPKDECSSCKRREKELEAALTSIAQAALEKAAIGADTNGVIYIHSLIEDLKAEKENVKRLDEPESLNWIRDTYGIPINKKEEKK